MVQNDESKRDIMVDLIMKTRKLITQINTDKDYNDPTQVLYVISL